MATIVKKLIARNVVITVTPIREVGGVLFQDTALILTGRAGRLTMTNRRTTEEVSANDSLNENHITIKMGWRLSVEAIKHIAGPELEDIAMLYEFAQVQIDSPRSGGVSAHRVYTGTIEEHSWTIEPGKNLDTISLLPIDVGASNPFFTIA